MPKVNISRTAKLDDASRKVYSFFCAGISDDQACKIMGYSRPTHYKRQKNPEQFTLGELRILYREAKLPDEVFMRMIREEPDAQRRN